jgi:hypothetical protein
MTREDIIERMGWMPVSDYEMSEMLDRIERIVAAAIEAEREACARVCEMQENRIVQTHPARIEFDPNSMMARKCAAAIRARGSK